MTQDTNTEPKNKVMYSPEGLTQLILTRNLYGYVIGNYNYYSLMLYRKKVTSRSPTMYHRALRLKCLQVSFEPIESVSGRYVLYYALEILTCSFFQTRLWWEFAKYVKGSNFLVHELDRAASDISKAMDNVICRNVIMILLSMYDNAHF